MGDYIAKSRNLVIILLISISAAAYLAQASEYEPTPFEKYRVHIVNELSSGKEPVHVHCWSSDNDLGLHDLYPKDDLNWHFKMNIWMSTTFRCHIEWNRKKADFKIFDAGLGFNYCSNENVSICWWAVKEDGFYFADHENPSPEDLHKIENWN